MYQEDLKISEVLPFHNNCTLPSRILSWIQNVEPKITPLPAVVFQECLIFCIKKQVRDEQQYIMYLNKIN